MLFLDASHDLDLNKAFWVNNEDAFSETCLVIVHDTGLWADGHFEEASLKNFGIRGILRGVSGRFHQPDEVAFVQWVTDPARVNGKGPTWTRVDIGSPNTFRHGFTILQRKVDVPLRRVL